MRLGCSYGAFSGLELLKPSLVNIRPFADHIVVVWSPHSSTGDLAPKYMMPLLLDLKQGGLIDELVEFRPAIASRPIEMQDNCRMKREIGRVRCQLAGCTHHLVRDCDEFYDPHQFQNVLPVFEQVDLGLCPIVEYVQKPTTRIKGISNLWVPSVHRIESSLRRYAVFGCTVDLGRTVYPVKEFRKFTPDELALHHYTFVRVNDVELRRKYQGHGHLNRVGTEQDFLHKVYGYGPDELETVPDVFGIQEYWEGEFRQWLR